MADGVAPMELRLMAAVSGSLEGVNITKLCADLGVSTKTFYKWKRRYEAEGLAGLTPRSRRPERSPGRTSVEIEDRVVELRKQLGEEHLDHGAATICWHLQRRGLRAPSEATVWRILKRRGFVTPAPKKRPRSSWRRFEASAPNELWQIDGTRWVLADNVEVKIIDVLDDQSRYLVASVASRTESSAAAWTAFSAGVHDVGLPSGCLSDNGLAFSGKLRGIEVDFEINLRQVGVQAITAAPFHPQTCGKVERFHQTLKKWLRGQPVAATLVELQEQLDWFRRYYNHERPHRAIGRITPWERFCASPRLHPTGEPIDTPQRHGAITVTAEGVAVVRPWRIGLGVEYAGQPAEIYVDGTDANIFINGQLIRHVTLDPTRCYQPSGRKRGGPRQPRHPA